MYMLGLSRARHDWQAASFISKWDQPNDRKRGHATL